MNWYKKVVFENYANFDGRARRSEYWYFVLLNTIFVFLALLINPVLYGLYALLVLLPGLAVSVRRLHDVGKSGAWLFISLAPIIGGIWLLVLMATEGDIGYTNYSDHLMLDYRHRGTGSEWQPVKQRIDYDRTSCNYGGHRLWFFCPRCNKRVAVLYCEDALFYCRRCYDIPYTTQYQGRMDSLIDKKHALGKRIFEHYEYGEGWGKKKGMHLKTFNRLHARYEALEQRWFQIVVRYLPGYAKFTD